MSVLYAVDFRSWLCTSMLLLESQGFDLPFFVILSMCFPHLRSSDIVTPRYLAAEVLSSSMLWRKYLEGIGAVSLVICRI